MDHPAGLLRTGDRATEEFEFIAHPEYIKEGMKLLFREGKTKVSLMFWSRFFLVTKAYTGSWGCHSIIVTRIGAGCKPVVF